MLDVLARLTAIQQYAKDIHYTAKADSFLFSPASCYPDLSF